LIRFNFLIILIVLFSACNSIEEESVKLKNGYFSKEEFNNKFTYLINNPDILDDSLILNDLYRSVRTIENSFIFLTQNIDSTNIDYQLDIASQGCHSDPPSIKVRNIFNFSIYNDSIFARLEHVSNKDILNDSLIKFIGNTNKEGYYYPEFKMTRVPLLDDTLVSKQVFIMNLNLVDTLKHRQEWKNLIKTIKLVEYAYDQVRNVSSQNIWNKNFQELSWTQKQSILNIHPYRMIFNIDRILKKPPPPPPPPAAYRESDEV
jgi:hypothetical protein